MPANVASGSADQAGSERAPVDSAAPAADGPGLYQRFKQAAKKLKREVLALYFALQDPRVGILPRAFGFLAICYALSPIDIIPDFIPIMGLIDDLVLLPGLIWLTVKLIPSSVMADARAKVDQEPLRLHRNWGMACVVLVLWDGLLLWLLWLGCGAWGSPWVLQHQWWVVGGAAAVLAAAEAAWLVWAVRREKRKISAAAGGAASDEGGDLEEGLLQGDDEGEGEQLQGGEQEQGQ